MGDGADDCISELAEHAEDPCHAVDEHARGLLRHELPVYGMEECCECTREGGGEGRPVHEAHSDSGRARCLPVDDTGTHKDHERPSAAMPSHRHTTEHLHHVRPRHQRRAEVGSVQGAVCDGDTLWGEDLLGRSGCVTAAVQWALHEVEELHQSDALMHSEGCWPHPDLTHVCATASLSLLSFANAWDGS